MKSVTLPSTQAVDEIRKAAAHEKSKRDRKHRVLRAGSGEVDDHPDDRDTREDRHE